MKKCTNGCGTFTNILGRELCPNCRSPLVDAPLTQQQPFDNIPLANPKRQEVALELLKVLLVKSEANEITPEKIDDICKAAYRLADRFLSHG